MYGRDGEEAGWAEGDVKLRHRPDGLSNTQEALVLERTFRVR